MFKTCWLGIPAIPLVARQKIGRKSTANGSSDWSQVSSYGVHAKTVYFKLW